MESSPSQSRRDRVSLLGWGSLGVGVLLSWYVGAEAAIDPETVQGVALGAFWVTVVAIVLYSRAKQWSNGRWWAQLLLAGVLARVVFAFIHIQIGLVFYRGAVDFVGYRVTAIQVGAGFFTDYLQTAVNYLVGFDIVSMLLGIHYVLVGRSLTGMFLIASIAGLLGAYLFVRAYQRAFPDCDGQRFFGVMLFLFPSVAYWSILLGKDSLTFLFMGCATYAFARLLSKGSFRCGLLLLLSLVALIAIRAPVGGILALAMGCAWGLKYLRARRTGAGAILRPVMILVLLGSVVGAVTGVGWYYFSNYYHLFSAFTIKNLLEIALIKHQGLATDPTSRGSSLGVGLTEVSFGAVLSYLPGAIFTFLFRPLIFEAHHVVALAAALEGTVFLVLVIWRLRNLVRALTLMLRHPFVLYAVASFVLLTGMLAFESNLGVIVRHRAMVFPSLLMLMALSAKGTAADTCGGRRSGERTASYVG